MTGTTKPAPTQDLDIVKAIILDSLAPFRVRVFLFGSRARGDSRGASDIDVAVEVLEPLPVGLLSEIREKLDESHVPFHVDLVDLVTATTELRDAVVREGIPWRT